MTFTEEGQRETWKLAIVKDIMSSEESAMKGDEEVIIVNPNSNPNPNSTLEKQTSQPDDEEPRLQDRLLDVKFQNCVSTNAIPKSLRRI